jgi:hypothetical protein
MKPTNSWITYRTRFLVKAKPLTTNLTFTDALGRQHSGRKGDYLVESDGVLRIASRQIFEDIYVPLAASSEEDFESSSDFSQPVRQASETSQSRQISIDFCPPHLKRKSPQPDRTRRSQIFGLGSL